MTYNCGARGVYLFNIQIFIRTIAENYKHVNISNKEPFIEY